jgi:uncharacterized protein YcbX
MPSGRSVDTAPILVPTTVSLRTAAGHHSGGTRDPRRLRPNILLDVDGDGWLEDSCLGHPIKIDAVMLFPTQPCIRCTMVTRSQPGLDAEPDVPRPCPA